MIEKRIGRILGNPFLVGWSIIIALTFLLTMTDVRDKGDHQRLMDQIHRLELLHSEFERSLLLIRYADFINFDLIENPMRGMNSELNQLISGPVPLYHQGNQVIDQMLEDLSESFIRKKSLVERFKSSIAIYKTSFDFISRSGFKTGLFQPEDQQLYALTVTYFNDGDEELRTRIEELIEDQRGKRNHNKETSREDSHQSDERNDSLATHIEVVLKYKPQIDLIVDQLLKHPMQNLMEQIENLYIKTYQEEIQEAWYAQLVLYFTALLLLGWVGSVLVRLTEKSRNLQQSEERYALAAKGANDGLWDWNIPKDILVLSPRWFEMIGESSLETTKSGYWLDRIHPQDREAVQYQLDKHLHGDSPFFVADYRLKHRDGSWRWVLSRGTSIYDESGKAIRFAGSQTDITSNKHIEARLEFNAFHDELTGLPNRKLFLDRLRQLILHAHRFPKYRFGVLYLDMDNFKNINEGLGHMSGDLLLGALALRLQRQVRPNDTVARLGGDEFAIIVDDVDDITDALQVVERIQSEVSHPYDISEQEVFATLSIGITMSDSRYSEADEMLRDADNALYRAKSTSKGSYQIFDVEMHQNALTRLQLESEMRRAVKRSEFVVYYQPIVNMATSKILGFEALVRWRNPLKGLIPPYEFIPLAEETGLIGEIGQQVMRQACKQVAEWNLLRKSDDQLYVSVNVSGVQLMNGHLVNDIDHILAQTSLQPSSLAVEMTESLLMDGSMAIIQQLQQLRSRGIGLYIDDFGTGYSSLSYLHQYPFSTIKIDRSFVNNMERGDDVSLVDTIIQMAHSLGMRVLAEGVETQKQVDALLKLDCQLCQGFLYSPAIPADEMEVLLKQDELKPIKS